MVHRRTHTGDKVLLAYFQRFLKCDYLKLQYHLGSSIYPYYSFFFLFDRMHRFDENYLPSSRMIFFTIIFFFSHINVQHAT